MNKIKAFTLIEMTITLIVFSLIIGLGIFLFPKQVQEMSEKNFWNQFDGQYGSLYRQGIQYKESVRVIFYDKYLKFIGPKTNMTVEYPSSLNKVGNEYMKQIQISENNYQTPATIRFDSTNGYRYNLVFQLSQGGVYRLEKIKH